MDNIIKLTDSYKISHHKLYPKNTRYCYFYLESRGGQFNQTTFFGLQYLLKKYLEGPVVTREGIESAAVRFKKHFGRDDVFNRTGWEYILTKHYGYLPIEVNAVKEGVVTDVSNILLSVQNTDPKCWWLPGYLEPLFVQLWYPISVCTLSGEIRKVIQNYMNKTSDNSDVSYKLHDFGFRGVSSIESSAIGGAAHLVNFKGTDTLSALDLLEDYYQEDNAGHSIPATEHSVITSWGKENELEAYRNLLEQFPTGVIACVSDSYNIYTACKDLWGNELHNKVMERDGVLVVRPDSGDPSDVVFKVLKILGERFGTTTNSKQCKVLNPKVRIIQGDGVDLNTISNILGKMAVYNWSAENIVFGSGGALLQKMNRDTQKFAFKCSAIKIDNEWRDVYKQPVDDGVKISKKGRLKLIDGKTVRIEEYGKNQLELVMIGGIVTRIQSLKQIREIRWSNM